MPSLKTNFLRTQITSICLKYEIQIISNETVDHQHVAELEKYFLEIDSQIVFELPYLYSVKELKLSNFNYMLSNGQKIQVVIGKDIITINSKEASQQIHKQIMKNTNFLYSEKLSICLNPFEEQKFKDNSALSVMPGFTISTEIVNQHIGFYLVPLQIRITEFNSLTLATQILLNYNNGSFYQKQNIVRYDKANSEVYFRNGQKIKTANLKSIEILPLSGYKLASRLNNYFLRIKQGTAQFRKIWQIKFDSKFLEIPYNFFPVCHLYLRGNREKSLSQVLSSNSHFNYCYNFKRFFEGQSFDDVIRTNIYFFVTQKHRNLVPPLIAQFESIKHKMALQCKINYVNFKSLGQIPEILSYVEKEKTKDNGQKIYVIPKITNDAEEVQSIKNLVQTLINSKTYFHIVKFNQDVKLDFQVISLKQLSIIYEKLRINPWRIKDVPFGTKPLMVFSTHVKASHGGQLYISLVGTMNAFLSKHTCLFRKSSFQALPNTITQMIDQCLHKFKSIHKTSPVRAIIFRRGDCLQSVSNEFQMLQHALLKGQHGCKPTYVNLSCSNPMRVFNQIDMNYISNHTVKASSLLTQFVYNDQRYIQLESESPLYKIRFLGADPQDQNFEQKIIDLTAKLCFSRMDSVQSGKGLGFISFAERLNQFICSGSYNIEPISGYLKDGVLLYL